MCSASLPGGESKVKRRSTGPVSGGPKGRDDRMGNCDALPEGRGVNVLSGSQRLEHPVAGGYESALLEECTDLSQGLVPFRGIQPVNHQAGAEEVAEPHAWSRLKGSRNSQRRL